MGKPEPSPALAAETNVLREVYAALNRNDIAAMVEAFDPQVEWIDPAPPDPPDMPDSRNPTGGAYRGLAAVKAHISQARAMWAEGSCQPRRFVVAPPHAPAAATSSDPADHGPAAGDRIVVLVDVRVRLKHETQWREGRLADVYTFRNGKVVQGRSFADPRQGLAWAGVKDSSEAG